jgi:uncharacterized protein YbaR (Trm112 family)
MTINIPTSIDNERIYNPADGAADQHLDIVACPECAATAAVQGRGPVESTDGPLGHVHITCVSGHWFMMPADMLNEVTNQCLPAESRS